MIRAEDFNEDQNRMSFLMSEYSESKWHAGWIMGLEKSIWEDLENFPELKELSDKTGGWIIWYDEEYKDVMPPIEGYIGEAFISLMEWERIKDEVWT